MTAPRSHRFRPRYRGVAWTSIGIGGALAALAIGMELAALPLVTGALGVVLGTAYLASPTWRLEVVVDEAGLEVRSARRSRFRIAWGDIVRVVASPATHTCFVDGGAPERSLLVPGEGAPAPYDLADRAELVAAILARTPADRVQLVESLERATPPRA